MAASVLVVDDEETARMAVSEVFTHQRFISFEAGTLAEARQIINQDGTDIIILDVRLPDGYGPHL